VEDDFALLKLMRRVLAEHGYTVLEARNGTEALEAARVHSGDVDLLVTDVVMPALGGVGLARALRERRPDLPALFVSGYAPQVVEPGSRFLAKPFSPARLAAEVRALLADRQPAG
jgi:CheY-like chemotaxis protein